MHRPLMTAARSSLLALLLVSPAVAAEPAGKMPRYRLEVGQELSYRGSGEFKYDRGRLLDRSSWRIWVARANSDGSWRLVIRHGNAFAQDAGKGPAPEKEDVTFAYCDFFPDGRIVENDSFGFRLKPESVLPRLPRDEAEVAKGWTGKNQRMDETDLYHAVAGPAPAGRFVFEVVREQAMNPIYGFVFKDKVTFDTERGLPVQIDAQSQQTYGFNGKGQGTTKLEGVKQHDAAWCKEFAVDADAYFAAQADYQGVLGGKKRTANETKAALEKAADGLKAARKELKLPEFQKQVDELLSRHAQSQQYYVENAERQSAVVDKPAADWATTDLDGKPHALKDYRGKVVILDFWYRGCGWCMRAMPQLIELSHDFQGQPVAVLGMNTDRDEKDARLVVDKMKIPYPVLKAQGLPEKYQVRGFPTLIVIDPKGIVHDVHVGYSPTLRDDVGKVVKELLTRK